MPEFSKVADGQSTAHTVWTRAKAAACRRNALIQNETGALTAWVRSEAEVGNSRLETILTSTLGLARLLTFHAMLQANITVACEASITESIVSISMC